jgi:hypothetical protein
MPKPIGPHPSLDYEQTVALLQSLFEHAFVTINIYESERGYPSVVLSGELILDARPDHVLLNLRNERAQVPVTGAVILHSRAFVETTPPFSRERDAVLIRHAGLEMDLSAPGVVVSWW